ncbi:MAG: zinc ribbon domain-containing protein [Oscillospiraceae bacterium]|nr:zinc ribbon domain-containing protein [Oscillospiraceae bacterium]
MFIIWGSRIMRKALAQVGYFTCPNCHNASAHALVRMRTWFTLFFIPIFPIFSRYYVVCPVCGASVQVDRKERDRILAAQEGILTANQSPQETTPQPAIDTPTAETAGNINSEQ